MSPCRAYCLLISRGRSSDTVNAPSALGSRLPALRTAPPVAADRERPWTNLSRARHQHSHRTVYIVPRQARNEMNFQELPETGLCRIRSLEFRPLACVQCCLIDARFEGLQVRLYRSKCFIMDNEQQEFCSILCGKFPKLPT